MSGIFADLRYALGALRRSPGFTAVAVLTLALGIGANTAIFSVINGVLLRPLPYPESSRLVSVASQFPSLGFDRFWISAPEFLELRDWNRSFENIGGYRTGLASVGGVDRPVRVTSASATADVFTTLGVRAQLGRTFTEAEDLPGGPSVTVVSDELWRTVLGGDPSIVGRTIQVNGLTREMVGVMPPGFDIDDAGVQVWTPVALDPANREENRSNHFLNVIARMRDGVTLERVRTELGSLMGRWQEEFGGSHAPHPDNHALIAHGLQDEMVGSVRPALLLLLGAVGFVLLIACANVGNLLLVRAESRQKEIAVRAALGAGRWRLLRPFLLESLLLAAVGGVLGVLLAWAGLRVLLATSGDSIPRLGEIGVDGNVLAFTAAVSVITGILFGLAPLMNLSERVVGMSLREGGQRATAGSARLRARRLLVVSEVALAVVLLVGAALMLRSFSALLRVDPGFDPKNLLTFRLFLPEASYPDGASQVAFYDRLRDRLRGLPAVTHVAVMSGLPPRRDVNANNMELEGYHYQPDTDMAIPNVDYWQNVTTDYLETMRIPLVEGRAFSPADGGEAAPVLLINETFARVFYPDQNPTGRRIRPYSDAPWFTVVGIVKDVKQGGLEEQTGTEMYFHIPQAAAFNIPRAMNVVLRTASPPLGLLPAVRQELAALDSSLPLGDPGTLEHVVSTSVAEPRFLTLLLGIFAAVALALAAVGTYGVMSYAVAERRQEIGIRMALGAERGRVLGMILRQGLSVATVGLILGVIGAFALSRFLTSLLFEVPPTDTTAYLAAILVLGMVATVACAIPALRAMRMDPARVLRQE
ncbi:MAG: FtsX-like permease family protein [Luteitalea sp.]|nr:FtsX-like permease family protein [Luteitalea sp.]